MPTNRYTRRIERRQDVTPNVWNWLLDENPQMRTEDGGLDYELFQLEGEWIHHRGGDRDKLRELWRQVEGDLLAEYIREHPGHRPRVWWWYSAPKVMFEQRISIPEPRRLLRGAGVPAHERLNLWPGFDHGIARAWYGYDPNDPPVFESEPAYLKRHTLLTATEERTLTPTDFEPVTVDYSAANYDVVAGLDLARNFDLPATTKVVQ